MFLDGIHHSDDKFRRDAEELSKSFLAVMQFYQSRRPTPELIGSTTAPSDLTQVQAGTITLHAILAGNAFSLAVLIKDLPRRERKKLREYLFSKFDAVLAELGS